jgi:hypothetical protein
LDVTDAITRLVGIGRQALSSTPVTIHSEVVSIDERLGSELVSLLTLKNGFYAFESALHVLPSMPAEGEYGLEEWNTSATWRADYRGLADGCFFFAEDVFGVQFCLLEGIVMTFDPETGDRSVIASSVLEWASKILDERDMLTGYPVAYEWQRQNGAIPRGSRLIPKTPFVLGGEFEIENLFLLESARAMRSRANLALQIKDLPDGTTVVFKIVD